MLGRHRQPSNTMPTVCILAMENCNWEFASRLKRKPNRSRSTAGGKVGIILTQQRKAGGSPVSLIPPESYPGRTHWQCIRAQKISSHFSVAACNTIAAGLVNLSGTQNQQSSGVAKYDMKVRGLAVTCMGSGVVPDAKQSRTGAQHLRKRRRLLNPKLTLKNTVTCPRLHCLVCN